MRILLLDIETSPNLCYTWGTFKQFISPKQIVTPQRVMSWAAKWYGEKGVLYDSLFDSTEKSMLKKMHTLMHEADVIVTFYGTEFDTPRLNTEFVKHGFKPPSPYKQIDLKKVAANVFRFPSNKLEYIVKALGIGEKGEVGDKWTHWIACTEGDPKAWKIMKKYNIQDTALLEGLYNKLMPWIKNHPNHGSYNHDNKEVCPNCGGTHLQRRGSRVAKLLRYPQYQCQDCGKWFRSNEAIPNRKKIKRYVEV
jgi:DNA polymerase elongation subunit (family B)/predicted RNA-binding Zn-ribbon protein involved in translation (DUF1610 family)